MRARWAKAPQIEALIFVDAAALQCVGCSLQ